MKIIRCFLCFICYYSSWSMIKCKEVLSHVFIYFHNSCFISASITIVWCWENDNSISCSIWAKKHMPFLSWQFPKEGKGMPRLNYFRKIEMELVLEYEHMLDQEMEHPQDQTRWEPLFLINYINIFNSRVNFLLI